MDKYDEAVEYLSQHPEEIVSCWSYPNTHKYGYLFRFCRPEGIKSDNSGCLTLIRLGRTNDNFRHKGVYKSNELTDAVRSDDRLPTAGFLTTVEHLPVFAEWWRKIDKHFAELGYKC